MWYVASSSCGVAREKGLLVAVLTTIQTHFVFFQKIAPVLNIFLHVKIFKTGKRHSVSVKLSKRLPKRPFSLAAPQLDEAPYHIGTHIT